jgi:hypothetical protein
MRPRFMIRPVANTSVIQLNVHWYL